MTLLQSDLLREHTFFPIGGGSNLLFVKEMYNGVLLHSAIQGMAVSEETDTEVLVEIGAGVVWDDFVAWTVSNGWGGAENLSYIPGEVGASAIQNIGLANPVPFEMQSVGMVTEAVFSSTIGRVDISLHR